MVGKSKTPVRCGLPRYRVISLEVSSVGIGVSVGSGAEVVAGKEVQAVNMNTIQPERIILTEWTNTFSVDLFIIGITPLTVNYAIDKAKYPISV